VVTRGKIEIMKLVQVETMRIVQIEKLYAENINAENTIQNTCLLVSQILMLMEKRGQQCLYEHFGCRQHEAK
jgi:hypothetical protein